VLPFDYAFTAADQGVHTFSATLKTVGTQSLTATKPTNTGVTGTQAGVTVSPGAADNFVLAGNTQVTAGSLVNVRVTVVDACGNLVPGYTGTIHFTSTDAGASLPADYTFTLADQGTHIFAVSLVRAGYQTVTATDTHPGPHGGLGAFVTPLVFDHLSVSGPAVVQVGRAASIVVTACDRFGNSTSYTGTIHFSATDPQAVLPANYTFTSFEGGTHRFSVTFNTEGSWTVSANDLVNPAISGSILVDVTIPTPTTVTASAGTPQQARSGTAFATQLTATVWDAYGNRIPGVIVTFTAPANGPTGTFASGPPNVAVAVTGTDGVARAPAFVAGIVPGRYAVIATVAGVQTSARFDLTNLPAPATVQSVVVNDGLPQRSMVTSLTVTFNTIVGFPLGVDTSFRLTGPNGAVALTADRSQSTLTKTVVRLRFTGPDVVGGSLPDGRYTLGVLAAQVYDALGQSLDGNGDGLPGGDYVSANSAGLFRLFGDASGDGVVTALDLVSVRSAFGSAIGSVVYLDFLDFNGDGVIDVADVAQIRTRFGTVPP
jgi:hypothetical protein